MIGSGLLAVIILYLAGAEGYTFLWSAIIIYFTILMVAGLLRGMIFPLKLAIDTRWDPGGGILHLSDPPDLPKKP